MPHFKDLSNQNTEMGNTQNEQKVYENQEAKRGVSPIKYDHDQMNRDYFTQVQSGEKEPLMAQFIGQSNNIISLNPHLEEDLPK